MGQVDEDEKVLDDCMMRTLIAVECECLNYYFRKF